MSHIQTDTNTRGSSINVSAVCIPAKLKATSTWRPSSGTFTWHESPHDHLNVADLVRLSPLCTKGENKSHLIKNSCCFILHNLLQTTEILILRASRSNEEEEEETELLSQECVFLSSVSSSSSSSSPSPLVLWLTWRVSWCVNLLFSTSLLL